eukprot:TRINITY_DN57_c4_g2_i1.p1 TRINITY_DN57_c4_g2~~TRINITY_DN57_c4_g2_i1.p1  ORF type:complete len:107 (+),score=2.72 TRINITY_DN57_c4_g2_i1:37-357(+)
MGRVKFWQRRAFQRFLLKDISSVVEVRRPPLPSPPCEHEFRDLVSSWAAYGIESNLAKPSLRKLEQASARWDELTQEKATAVRYRKLMLNHIVRIANKQLRSKKKY